MSRREDEWDCTRTERSHDDKVRRREHLGRLERRVSLIQSRLESRFRVRVLLLGRKGGCGEAWRLTG